jgi:hypothetical protein
LIVASAVALTFIVWLLFDPLKLAVLLLLRMAGPGPVASPEARDEAQGTGPFVIAFDEAAGGNNLFYSNDPSGAWQHHGRHTLSIRLSRNGPTFEAASFGTMIGYLHGRMSNVYFYPTKPKVKYWEAVSACKQQFQRWGIDSAVAWAEYERRLDEPVPVTDEVFVPEVKLDRARILVDMQCDWTRPAPARTQIDRVRCHPSISLDVR